MWISRYLQEFQYGKETVRTTTNNGWTNIFYLWTLFGYGNIEWQENLMFSNERAGSIPARATKKWRFPKGAVIFFMPRCDDCLELYPVFPTAKITISVQICKLINTFNKRVKVMLNTKKGLELSPKSIIFEVGFQDTGPTAMRRTVYINMLIKC